MRIKIADLFRTVMYLQIADNSISPRIGGSIAEIKKRALGQL
jgi:hypothetical protein